MGGGDVGLGDKLGESDAGENEDGARGGNQAEVLAGDEVGRDPREDGFKGKQQRGVRGGRMDWAQLWIENAAAVASAAAMTKAVIRREVT